MTDDPQPEVLTVAYSAVERAIRSALVVQGGPLPPLGSPAWLAAPWQAQSATLAMHGTWCLWRSPDRIAAEVLKSASVAISEELKRERELVRRRKDAIGAALRRGDAARAYALTVHHAGWQWAEEIDS